jgi:spermidine synthase
MFAYYHPDANMVRNSPFSRIVIDDGRRFLDGSNEKYDIIIVDPPPPPSAPGSSLLYSREFYDIVKKHLATGGILQMWHPTTEGDPPTAAAVTKSLMQAFPYVRAFVAVDGYGVHYLASMQAIPTSTAGVLASRLPPQAASDLTEWGPGHSAEEQFQNLLSREVELQKFLALDPQVPAITDNEPINEYYLLRSWFHYYR